MPVNAILSMGLRISLFVEESLEPRSYQGIEAIAQDAQILAESVESGTWIQTQPSGSEVIREENVVGDGSSEESFASEYDPLKDSPEALRAHQWIKSGIALLSIGTVLGVGALALGLTDPCNLNAGNGCQKPAHARAAWTMGIPGALMVVGGAAMLIVGKQQKRRLQIQLQFDRQGAMATAGMQF